jgi:L-amino acid N-acyltransferase YncA
VEIQIDVMRPSDWPAVRTIYEAGIATGNATFQTEAPSWDAWDAAHLASCRLVARDVTGAAVGWAALSPVSTRPVYAGVVEVSVYVAPNARGKGVGRRLLEALVAAAERDGRWTLQAGIFPENEASVALHARCGFGVVGRRERLGCLHGVWRDVLLMERRSIVVGTDGRLDREQGESAHSSDNRELTNR